MILIVGCNCDDSAWIVVGDLNEALRDSEQYGGSIYGKPNMERLRDKFFYINLRDLGFSGATYIWMNRGVNRAPVLKRLDKFLRNGKFIRSFSNK